MSTKEKDKSLQDRLKTLFKGNRSALGNCKGKDFQLSEDIQNEISSAAPIPNRLKAINELNDIIVKYKIEDSGVEKLWSLVQDLISINNAPEIRILVFKFLENLIKCQYERLGILRLQIFRVITDNKHSPDISYYFEMLQNLTDNGKDILYFEDKMASFVLSWIPHLNEAGKKEELLEFSVNLIKFNSGPIDEDIISGYIQHVCTLSCTTKQSHIVMSCLNIMDTIVAYSTVPPESLPQFVGALCRAVNGEAYCKTSWKIMRNLLGTHMGHATLVTMCRILQEPCLKDDTALLRGAVFYINMGLWGNQPVPNLKSPPSGVLPSLTQVVKCNQPIIAYEVVLAMQRLIHKHGYELLDPAWDSVLNILSIIIRQLEMVQQREITERVQNHLNETLNSIESLLELGTYNGSIKKYFDIIGECSSTRPDSSVMKLIKYLAEFITPAEHLWLNNLYILLERFFKNETRTNIRLKALDVLTKTYNSYRQNFEDELLNRIVVPLFQNIQHDHDSLVRCAVVEFLQQATVQCETKQAMDMLDIMEKVLHRPFEQTDDAPLPLSEFTDIDTVVSGLIKVFYQKLHCLPSSHAIKILKIFINHLEEHYKRPHVFANYNMIRLKIFECLLQLRANMEYHLGAPCLNMPTKIRYSKYLCVTYQGSERSSVSSPPPTSPVVQQLPAMSITYMPVRPAVTIVIAALTKEKDWEVLSVLLEKIPLVLQNRALVMTRQGNNELSILIKTLTEMMLNKDLPASLNPSVPRQDFQAMVLLVLAHLACYYTYIDPKYHQNMIRCLYKGGMSKKCASACISSLTTCTLEMGDVMVKVLPDTLLHLSKISARTDFAVPILEFLSTITVIPSLYASFVADQFMSIFAIALPFTNPFKYNHYVVSLAHHVIAVWFLKCRLPFRKEFVKFITNGLQTNILTPFEETSTYNQKTEPINVVNQDSSDRKRSSSLTEQISRRRERTATIVGRPSTTQTNKGVPQVDKDLITFYEELTETSIDLMARYTFSPCSAKPSRLPTTDFILQGGHSSTWLIGNRIVTITTSGCNQNVLKWGLCDKCLTCCKIDADSDLLMKSEPGSSGTSRQNSGENPTSSSPSDESPRPDRFFSSKTQHEDSNKHLKLRCCCWCQGWSEIYIRRPTGDISWTMRIQNSTFMMQALAEFPFNDISKAFMPSYQIPEGSTNQQVVQCDPQILYQQELFQDETIPSNSNISAPQYLDFASNDSPDNIYGEESRKSRNPVRRSNSSPEMSANWKNPFMIQKDHLDEDPTKKKGFTKDMRVSCEAIPEEIAGLGTTPPSHESSIPSTITETHSTQTNHPTLVSYHSYPGSTGQQDTQNVPPSKSSQTVPPSPNILQTSSNLLMSTSSSSIRDSSISLKSTKSLSTESSSSDKGLERQGTLEGCPPLSSKPPHSPTSNFPPTTSRHSISGHEIQKSSSLVLERTAASTATEKMKEKTDLDEPDISQKRDRGYTISVMSPVRKPKLELTKDTKFLQEKEKEREREKEKRKETKSGNNASFIFLQLYHSSQCEPITEKPLLISSFNDKIQRAVKVLDLIPPYEVHKIGVIYIGQGQCNNEVEILRNEYGSYRFNEFLKGLGSLVKLSDVDPQFVFLGGLEQNGDDGNYAYVWHDDIIRVMFHVATLFPNKDNDPNGNNKKKHIGNDNIVIVYNESGEEYDINTIKCQFNFACVIVQPLDHGINRVTIKGKEKLEDLTGITYPKIVSDHSVSILARQVALHADLAALVQCSLDQNRHAPHASNWLERLRKIKQLRQKILSEDASTKDSIDEQCAKTRRVRMEDFTEYT